MGRAFRTANKETRFNLTIVCLLILLSIFAESTGSADEAEVIFEIREFVIEGNTLLPEEEIQKTLQPFTGNEKTAEDVEKSRETLENHYREKGWGTVLVSIPQQSVEDGIIRLQVIEGRIGRIKVIGNRYNTRSRILRDLPSLTPGTIPYVPNLQLELNRINAKQDIEVVPFLMPGRRPGTIDVELRVQDRLPLHGSLGLNNNASHDTEPLRLSASLSYENLWQQGHSVSLNYQVSPQDFDEVQAISGAYLFNPPWAGEHYLTFYGVFSDSDIATVGGTQTVGRGRIFGLRYIVPLWPYNHYYHNLTVGVDYKDFDEDIGFEDAEDFSTPITYVPFSFNYAGTRPDATGLTQVRAALNLSLRGLADQDEFEEKRFNARANYIYLQAGVERTQQLTAGLEFFGGVDGQISDQPLISNEQYLAGGMESVRGYKQAELSGDDAVHWTFELRSPDLASKFQLPENLTLVGYGFYEGAWLGIDDALPGEEDSQTIQGAGLGFRGTIWNQLSYRLDWGLALEDTERTDKGSSRFYFDVQYRF